jgi:hypothetical protein
MTDEREPALVHDLAEFASTKGFRLEGEPEFDRLGTRLVIVGPRPVGRVRQTAAALLLRLAVWLDPALDEPGDWERW